MTAQWIQAVVALGTFLLLVMNFRQGRNNGAAVGQVHELVNARSSKQDKRIEQLTTVLAATDVEIPKNRNGETR